LAKTTEEPGKSKDWALCAQRGAKGDKGDKGERGDKGEPGERGKQGIEGSPGAPAPRILEISLVGSKLFAIYEDGETGETDLSDFFRELEARLVAEVTAKSAEDDNDATALPMKRFRGGYETYYQYRRGDVVNSDGSLYLATEDLKGVFPATSDSWVMLMKGARR